VSNSKCLFCFVSRKLLECFMNTCQTIEERVKETHSSVVV
jgi:hypothetical protein